MTTLSSPSPRAAFPAAGPVTRPGRRRADGSHGLMHVSWDLIQATDWGLPRATDWGLRQAIGRNIRQATELNPS
jgi:hypothetical protein